MKTLITSFIILSVIVSNTFTEIEVSNNEDVIATTAKFDGAEGNYLFFTDEDNKALQFDSYDEAIIKKYNLIENNHVGESFDLSFKKNKLLRLKTSN